MESVVFHKYNAFKSTNLFIRMTYVFAEIRRNSDRRNRNVLNSYCRLTIFVNNTKILHTASN